MNILIIANTFPKPENRNTGTYIFEQCKSLIDQGITPIVCSPTIFVPGTFKVMGQKLNNYSNIPFEYIMDGIKIYYPKILLYNQLNFILNNVPKLKYWIYRILIMSTLEYIISNNQIDFIYSHGPLLEGMIGVELKEKYNIPLITIEHSITNVKKLEKNKHNFKTYRDVLLNSDCFICVSNVQKNLIKNLFINDYNMKVVHNGFKKNNNKYFAKKIENHKSPKINLLTIGFLEEQKGYLTILEALNELNKLRIDFRYTIIGAGGLEDEIKDKIKRYNLENKCFLLGKVPHEKVYDELQQTDIFILPSYNESFGIVYLEAMNHKVPIIGTKDEGISDIIKDGENGILIEKNNSNELIKKLILLIENKELRRKIAESGYITSENYTWNKNVEKLRNIFDDILKKNSIV